MADIDLDFNTIQSVATLFTNTGGDIDAQLGILEAKVINLIGTGGGLNMPQTGPAIETQYVNFTTSAGNCMAAIKNFADLFTGIQNSLTSADFKMAGNINNPTSSGS
jgi:hypothetical protein